MKLSTPTTIILLAASANAQCTASPPIYNETSKPFSLVLTSDNSTINGSTLIDVPSSAYFNYDPTTNIAIPILTPGSESPQLLAFDDQDRLNVQGYIDWAASPPNSTGSTQAYYSWYACQTYFSGYSYENLAWGLGPEKPQNPTCVSVGVKRVFV
ncbi:hypothetical protein E8E12_004138 [Didymella heteroderae]|uniref:Uncharacterized protein n=1 Tax=Didymella heteroderae TaxID=1769908 RepID=A0A9P4WK91_9PLEO|nr:hypothetical protein E8E12_004138 [Didymella heteroderae]